MPTYEKKIDAVQARIEYLDKRIKSGKADRQKSVLRIRHFEDEAKEAVVEWKKAEHKHDQQGQRKAKVHAAKAHKKLALWDEIFDDVDQGLDKAVKRRQHQWKKLRILHDLNNEFKQPTAQVGFATIDGHLVAKWMVPGILELRRRGLWHGIIVSGYRTPEYSRELCRRMCGHDTCPGMCAGTSSNHTCPPTFKGVFHEGAVDVTDYYNFGAGCRILGLDLRNALPMDRVHYSYTGG